MILSKRIVDHLVNVIVSLFDSQISKEYIYSLLSNFKGVVIIKNDVKNVGSYTMDGKIYISLKNLNRTDYLLHELLHVILNGKVEYGIEESICEYVAKLYRESSNSKYESYAYYAQVNIMEQIDYIYKNKNNTSIVVDLLNNIEQYKDVLLQVYSSIEEVEELLLSLNKLTDHDYYMTWNSLSLEEETKVYEEHDKIHYDISELNRNYSPDKNNNVFKIC